jgi:hypothetical protein
MDLSPREMIDLASACGVDVEFSNVNALEYAVAVGSAIGGRFHMRLEPPSVRAYLCGLLGCSVDTEWETVCAAAKRAAGKGASVRVHPDREELTENIADLGDYSRLGYGLLCCPMCSPPGLLCSDLTLPPMGMPCEACGTTDPKIGRLVLWIHPEHATWAQSAPEEE